MYPRWYFTAQEAAGTYYFMWPFPKSRMARQMDAYNKRSAAINAHLNYGKQHNINTHYITGSAPGEPSDYKTLKAKYPGYQKPKYVVRTRSGWVLGSGDKAYLDRYKEIHDGDYDGYTFD